MRRAPSPEFAPDAVVDAAVAPPSIWRRRYGRRLPRRGFALISTLVLLTAIAGVASLSVIRRVPEAAFFRGREQEMRDFLALESALSAGIFHLLDRRGVEFIRFRETRRMEWTHDGRIVDLFLESEAGKIDLNAGDIAMIGRAARELFPSQADAILARLRAARSERRLIWRVEDMLPLVERAGPLEILAKTHFTVYSGAMAVSPIMAPAAVLRAIPGITHQEVARILEAQRGGMFPPDLGAGVEARFFAIERPIHRIRAHFRERPERHAGRDALVEMDVRRGTWRRLMGGVIAGRIAAPTASE